MNTRRKVKRTLLAVGEGDTEKAFLTFLRSLYCRDGEGVKVVVRNAHGKGPDHVVDHAIRQSTTTSYDQVLALLDTDIPWSDALRKKAKRKKIVLVGSVPAIEGLLLLILERTVPTTTAACKSELGRIVKTSLTEASAYQQHFTREAIERARKQNADLNVLLTLFEGLHP